MKIKKYESFSDKNLSDFLDMVFVHTKSKVGDLYDLFQDLSDEGYILDIEICLKGPDYEDGYNRDLIELFFIDSDFNKSSIFGIDRYTNGEYEDWILNNDFDLILEDLVFVLYFGISDSVRVGQNRYSQLRMTEYADFRNSVDNFLPKLNSMFDYTFLEYSEISKYEIRITCEL